MSDYLHRKAPRSDRPIVIRSDNADSAVFWAWYCPARKRDWAVRNFYQAMREAAYCATHCYKGGR